MGNIATDMFLLKTYQYLIWVDRFSGYTWVHPFNKHPNISKVIEVLHNSFLQTGFPRRKRSDFGQQNRTEFNRWCTENKIIKETSSPYRSRSNRLAENAVKQVKNLIIKCQNTKASFEAAYLALKSCPRSSDGLSASELFYGRQLKIPGLPYIETQNDYNKLEQERQN